MYVPYIDHWTVIYLKAETVALSISWYARLLGHHSRCFQIALPCSHSLAIISCLSSGLASLHGREFQKDIGSSWGIPGTERHLARNERICLEEIKEA